MPLRCKYEELLKRYLGKDVAKANGEKEVHHCCVSCGSEYPRKVLNRCPKCQGAIDTIYDLAGRGLRDALSPLERHFAVVPIAREENLVWTGEGNTPCFHARHLGRHIGLSQLYVKDETANPTRSTKDRIGSMGLSYFKELGVREFVVASTGNSSTAYARAAQLVGGFTIHIFVGRAFLDRLNYVDHPQVKTYVVENDFVTAGAVAKQFADKNGILFEGGFFSLARREGLKLAYLEAFNTMPVAPAFVFQAVSSGMGLLGGYKGALEYLAMGRLSQLPRFMAVQQATCSPMARAYEEGSEKIQQRHIIRNPTGLAAAILRGDPSQSYPYIAGLCEASGGQILSATDDELREARRMIYELEGLNICFASATAVAGVIKLRRMDRIAANAPILVNITGSDRPLNPVPQRVTQVEESAA